MRLGWENVRGGYYIKKLFSAVNALKDKVLPNVTASDNGKTLVVADGAWSLGGKVVLVMLHMFTKFLMTTQ